MTNNAEARARLVLLIADLRAAIDSATASGGDDVVLHPSTGATASGGDDVVLHPSTGPGRNLGSREKASALLAALVDYLAEIRRQDGQ
jgi:hypothetical protein